MQIKTKLEVFETKFKNVMKCILSHVTNTDTHIDTDVCVCVRVSFKFHRVVLSFLSMLDLRAGGCTPLVITYGLWGICAQSTSLCSA